MSPPSCTQTNIHTFAPHVDTQKWTRYPHSHSPYALYTPRSRHHHPQRGSQRPIPELNPLRSGVGTGRPPRSPQQQRKSTAQTPTGRPAHPHSPRPRTENREQGFRSLDSSISKFLWKGKPPRISLKTLQKTKDKGGLDLPNFYHYFLANRLQHISGWLKHTLLDEPWLDVEQALCNNIEISDLPFISSISKRHVCFKSISISSSLTAWWEFLKMTESSLIPCKRTPIWNNPDILLNNNMINFTDWSCKGIKYLEHIFEGTDFIPFDKLIKQYGINKNRFLEYQQIKSIVKRKFKSNHINLQIPPSVSDFLNLKTPKLMSKIYRALSKIDESVSLPIAKWEADLSVNWDHNSGLRYV